MSTTARTWAQRARQDAYYPDTMSRQARSLVDMRAVARYWRQRTGPAGGNALEAATMIAIADRACLDIAAALIAAGCQP